MPNIFDSFDPPTVYVALSEVPTSATSVTSDTFRLLTLFLANVGTVDRTVTITNTAGTELIKDLVLPAKTVAPVLQFPYLRMVGLKWSASGTGVNGQVEGFADA